ncbi:alpha-galactosidase [Nocardioides sp. Leaf307]|uniref:alpha-galactosidase n=1 Tax=Nocardioides sp. Leaf307 TaxID=1736331 RepID=UPI000703B0A0|nr:alpha-galactosidase [Nocardioides sp. Leaf307]KQQ43700.1 alpha-galactosidase [Nocardioides sp. Leaf307]
MTDDRAVGAPTTLHLRAAGVSVLLAHHPDVDHGGPWVAHWGADLGPLDEAARGEVVGAGHRELTPNTVDELRPVGLLPEHASGWPGTPGLRGSRADGADWSPVLRVRRVSTTAADAPDPVDPADPAALGGSATYELVDAVAGLEVLLEVELLASGLLRTRATLTNTGEGDYRLDALEPALPVPTRAGELLDLTGRHARERSPQRRPVTVGAHVREGRRGRTGTDATLLTAVGEPGFGFRRGEVWATHVAWSGDHRSRVERATTGVTLVSGGELLLPGEVRLAPGESYASPWLYGSHGTGLDEVTARIHTHLRSRPQHPRRPRPVTLNTWEAVYFDHDLEVLTELAELAAEVGVERYVLDDGWFLGRRDDTAGLGDWYVDPTVWPDGLDPLIGRVRALGMEFGLWVEPEMVNLDSDLARAHPSWVLGTGGRVPVASRQQQVLDLAHPDAFAHVLERLDALLTAHDIAYLKWDHNRDLVDAGSGPAGAASVHRQTLAFYALVDELRRRHPGVEIESCSSGGGRIDLEVLERTDRVWASDCIDPLERQGIQRWTSLLVPPELLGAHIGSARSHTTGRTHDLSFRAGTALFGHLGIEWDLREATAAQREELAAWVALHRRLRPLLATGTTVRSDHPDPATLVHGIVSPAADHAVYAVVATAGPTTWPPGPVTLPGLDAASTYDVAALAPGDVVHGPGYSPLPWWSTGVRLTGRVLDTVGVQAPAQDPEHLVLIEVRRVG